MRSWPDPGAWPRKIHLAPRSGERSTREACRVRGSAMRERALAPHPSPCAGRGDRSAHVRSWPDPRRVAAEDSPRPAKRGEVDARSVSGEGFGHARACPGPLYLTGDWLALARSPPVPPRFAQQSWATLAPKGEGARRDSTARQTDAPQVTKTVGERGSSCRLSQAARTDERASSPHTPQGWAYQEQKSFAKGARDTNS